MIQQLFLDRVAVEPGHGAQPAGDRGAGAAAGFKVAGLPPRRSLPGLFKRLRARGPRRWRRWQRMNAPGLDYFAGTGQSNIESFRPAAGDPDAVAVKTAAIAAAMLKPTRTTCSSGGPPSSGRPAARW